MKKAFIALLSATLLAGPTVYSNALAYDEAWQIHKLKNKINRLKDSISQNTDDIQSNANEIEASSSDIADNFSQIQDLDSRLTDIESNPSGGSPGVRSFIDVDCEVDPNALLSPPINGIFPDNTTFNIVGACNGPLYVTEDGVRFVGVGVGASIVLPAGISNAADGAIFGDGAQDLRIQNLIIDASAWNSVANEGVESAGVYVRNAFVRVIDSDIIGGEYGINPFRGGLVRLQGTVNITEFLNVGISAGDHSLVTTRGQVNISSTQTEGSFMTGIELYRGGNMDFRQGVTVEMPVASGTLFPRAVSASNNSHLRIRAAGNVSLSGPVSLNSNSTFTMQGGTLAGDLGVIKGSSITMFNVIQTDGSNFFDSNSTSEMFDSTLKGFNVQRGAMVEVIGGEVDGAIVQTNGILNMSGTSVTNILTAEKPSLLDFNDGNMNGNTLFFCDEDTTFFDDSVVLSVDTCI